MNTKSLKRPALILTAVVLIAVIFWPLPAQFKYIGSQFLTFALALYVGLRIWRTSPKGAWLMNFQRNHKYSWTVYVLIFGLAGAITYLTVTTLGYWPRAALEFTPVIGIVYYFIRAFKRFLI